MSLLKQFLVQDQLSYAEAEGIVGKLVSLQCAVVPAVWFTQVMYDQMKKSAVISTTFKKERKLLMIKITEEMREE